MDRTDAASTLAVPPRHCYPTPCLQHPTAPAALPPDSPEVLGTQCVQKQHQGCWSVGGAGGLRLSFLTLQGGNSQMCFILSPRASLQGWVPPLCRRPLPNSTPCIAFLPTRLLSPPTVSATLGHLLNQSLSPRFLAQGLLLGKPKLTRPPGDSGFHLPTGLIPLGLCMLSSSSRLPRAQPLLLPVEVTLEVSRHLGCFPGPAAIRSPCSSSGKPPAPLKCRVSLAQETQEAWGGQLPAPRPAGCLASGA